MCLWSQWEGRKTYLGCILAFNFFDFSGLLRSTTLLVDLGVLYDRLGARRNICLLSFILVWWIRALTVVSGVIGWLILLSLSCSVVYGGKLRVGGSFWSLWGFCGSLSFAAGHVLLQNVVSVETLAAFVAFKGSIWGKKVLYAWKFSSFTFPIICQILVKLSYASKSSSSRNESNVYACSYFWWLTS